MTLFWCERCGMVRAATHAPVCRHFALDVPAARMVPLPPVASLREVGHMIPRPQATLLFLIYLTVLAAAVIAMAAG